MLWYTIMFYSKVRFTLAFYRQNLKICIFEFMYWGTEANQQWIGSFPANQCDRLVKSKTGFGSVNPSAIEPESELRPK